MRFHSRSLRGVRRTTVVLLATLGACHTASSRPAPVPVPVPPLIGSPPSYMLGTFVDDYGGHHRITPSEWFQGTSDRYRIVRWDTTGHYLIALNDSTSPTSLGKWTRIDWLELRMAPYTWAFCFSAYEAPTAAAAESALVAKPETPRTGCNGYPFTRMRADSARER